MQIPEDVCPWLVCRKIIVAKDLIPAVAAKLKLEDGVLKELLTVTGKSLSGSTYTHPLCDRESPVVIGGDYITTEAGTGLVHTAPGHGQEDFLVGQKYGLPLLSPVDDAGVFTAEAGQFEGLQVQGEGNTAVIQALKDAGVLLRTEDYKHKYPYDWRTKKPTIFRATDQWFASVEAFKSDVLQQIEAVQWQPAVGQNRITAMVQGRCGIAAHPSPVCREHFRRCAGRYEALCRMHEALCWSR
jgi:isoleucyl-tRNA synthetase